MMYPVNNYQNQLSAMASQIQQMQNNLPQYQQPMPIQPQPIAMPQQTMSIQTVSGYEGAHAFSMPPNSSALLMDNNELKVYFKSTDSNGMVTLKAYKMVEETTTEPTQTVDFVTKDDLETMKQELLNIINKNQGGKKP